MPPPSPNEAKHQARALELNSNIVNSAPILPPSKDAASLSEVIGDGNAAWSFSKEGGTGAMLVQSGVETSGGAAIKVEGVSAANQVMKSAQLMEVFFKNAQGEAPFSAPRVNIYGANGGDGQPPPAAELKAKLEGLHAASDDATKLRIGRQLDSLKDIEAGKAAIVKMEFAKGPTFNKLSQDEKMALLKSEQMGKMLGRALPAVVMLHENDHLGVDGGGSGFKANPTNMTFDPATGQPSLIDLSTGMNYIGDSPDKAPLAKLGQSGVAKTLETIHDFQLEAFESPESFEAAIEKMAGGKETPFTSMMSAFTKETDGMASMLNPEDENAAKSELTHEDKRRFAANLLVGSVDGMDYAKQNMEALKTAAKATHETMQVMDKQTKAAKEVHVEHFYTDAALQELDQQLQSMDVDALKEKAALRMDEMAQKRKQDVTQRLGELDQEAGTLQAQARELDKRIEKLENRKEGIQDKLKAAYRGRDNMIDELKERRQQLGNRMDDVRKESASIMNTDAFNDAMKKQAESAKARVNIAPVVADNHAQLDNDMHAEGIDGQKATVVDAGPNEESRKNKQSVAEALRSQRAEKMHSASDHEVGEDNSVGSKIPRRQSPVLGGTNSSSLHH
ncbi:MAG: hypothetical protein R3F13_14660 [Prosthecobacter sp.]